LTCQVFSLSAAELLIIGEASSVRISFGFTNPHRVAHVVR
jgi:hypothetical protein